MFTPARSCVLMLPMLLLAAAWGCDAGDAHEARQSAGGAAAVKIRNASFEPTVELYNDLDAAFERSDEAKRLGGVSVETFHGPSGKQAQAVCEGNQADVVTLGVDYDVDRIAAKKLIEGDWRSKLPNGASPMESTIIFLVRKGNPKQIRDWEDLARDDVTIVTPDPKTSGGARWVYVAAWGAVRAAGGDDAAARQLVTKIYDKAILDAGARQSTTRFVQERTGDVLVGWESEALRLAADEEVAGEFEAVVPSRSIRIALPVAVVDQVARSRNTTAASEAFANFLFTPEAQRVVAKHYFRPSDGAVLASLGDRFAKVETFDLETYFPGGWKPIMDQHFGTDGELDRMRR
jgi:sulfate/thiosulfate-binding protein